MTDAPKSHQRLFAELKRRRVFRVMAVYGAVGFVMLQIVELAVPALLLPDWTYRLVALLLFIGFPVAIVLAWAFEQTPAGLRRTEPASPEEIQAIVAQPASRRWPAGLLALAGAVLLLGGWWLGRSSGPGTDRAGPMSELDVNRVAVLPFRASVPEELSYLGEGFMDLLSTRLDGEVGPRAIDPAAVARRATGDSVDARGIARDLGAGLVVTGSVVGGPSGIVTSAEFLDVENGGVVATASAEGPPDSIAAIADELIGEFLSLQAGEHPESVARLTSTSPEALKAYLLGKQAWRDGDYYAAPAYFDEALAHDSTFALAGIARADGAVNTLGVDSGGGLELAWRHRDRLGRWDRMYLEARFPQSPRTRAEMERDFENLARSLPHHILAWYWLGEARIHGAGLVKDSAWAESVRAAFGRTLDIDPGYRPALDHLLFLEMQLGTPKNVQEIAAATAYDRGGSASVWDEVLGLASGAGELTLDPERLTDANLNRLIIAGLWPHIAPDYLPDDWIEYVEASWAELRRRVGAGVSPATPLLREYRTNLAMGRPIRALAVREEAIAEGVRGRYDHETVYGAIWYGIAADEAEEAVRRIDERLRSVDADALSLEDAEDLWTAEVWRYHRDPDHADLAAAARIRQAVSGESEREDLNAEGLALSLESWARVRRAESAAAESLGRLEEILEEMPYGLVTSTVSLLSLASALEEYGQPERALRALDRANLFTTIRDDLLRRERGRLAALVGDTTRALQEYGRYLTIRSDAEPSVAAEVTKVREAMQSLWGERYPGVVPEEVPDG